MPTFRILDQFPVYLNLSGQLADGGSLKFYDTGTTTPRDVYADPDKTVNNGTSVLIGSDGRPVVDIWGDGSYRVRLYDVDGTLIDEADDVEIQGGGGTAIPALETGKVLSNDGAVLQWVSVLEVPDPTGSSGKVLGNDGENLIWQAPPTPSSFAPVITPNSIKLGTIMLQWGSDTIAPTGANTANKAFSFATTFTALYYVEATLNGSSGTSGGIGIPVLSVGARSIAGATAFIDSNNDAFTIINSSPFTWFAVGSVPA